MDANGRILPSKRSGAPTKGAGDAYFCTGNAAKKFNQLDSHVWCRLRSFLVKRKGRHLKAGEAAKWTRDFFWSLGLHRLRGTVRYPEVA
jgi:hypothetical protein